MAKAPLRPLHPERTCWGCDRYCPATDLVCGNGSVRTQHPCELFGNDWVEWAERHERESGAKRRADAAPTAADGPGAA